MLTRPPLVVFQIVSLPSSSSQPAILSPSPTLKASLMPIKALIKDRIKSIRIYRGPVNHRVTNKKSR
jgi:hypothetical protein